MLVKGIILSVFILALTTLSGCKKSSGEGGSSRISGKVYAKHYNKYYTNITNEGYQPKADVYIIYGDDITYGDKQETNYDGSFQFKYLRKGSYKVYAYSGDSTGAFKGMVNTDATPVAILVKVEIVEDNKNVVIQDLNILK